MLCLQQRVGDAPHRFLLAPAVQPLRTLIPVSDAILPVPDEDGAVRQLKDQRLIAQGLFGSGARSDVRRNTDETRDGAIPVVRGGHRQIDFQRLAVFPNQGPFPFLMLASPGLLDKDIEALHRLAHFLCQFPTPGGYFGFQMKDRWRLPANHFVRSVPKHPLGAAIENRDQSLVSVAMIDTCVAASSTACNFPLLQLHWVPQHAFFHPWCARL